MRANDWRVDSPPGWVGRSVSCVVAAPFVASAGVRVVVLKAYPWDW